MNGEEKNSNSLGRTVVTWEAQEYIEYNKNAGWYIGLLLVGAVFAAFSIFLQWWSFTALIVISVLALIVYTVRPPRVVKYTLGTKGFLEGDRLYRFDDYKSFGIANENNHYSIVLTPRKRFSARVVIYFPGDRGEQIVDGFGARLPMAEVKMDFLDKIVKFIRL